MDSQPNAEPNNNTPPVPEKKKSLFDTILTATPVILTVIATFMVSQSTAEMTRAQFYRSVAGQNQSKVADQWGFFQAKRIRGTTYEVNADVFMAREEPVPISREYLLDSAHKLAAKVGDGKDEEKVIHAINTLKNCLDKGFTTSKGDVKRETVNSALAFMQDFNSIKLPTPIGDAKSEDNQEKKKTSAADDKGGEQQQLLKEVIKAIGERKSEKEIAQQVIKITDQTLHDAIEKADAEAKKTASKSKDAEQVLEQIDALLDSLAQAVYVYLASIDDKTQMAERTAIVRSHIHKIMISYKHARHIFTQRRYEKDARANQESAYLYEVKVYHSGAKSDRHMERSKNFLYAMLVAQVGVIIASMALAVKHKSFVWLLAALAGLVAAAFGGYVYYLGMI